MTNVEIKVVAGEGVIPYLTDVAELRIRVFRDFPYLYDGDTAYEEGYLRHYAAAETALFVLAVVDGKVVGVSTAVAMTEADSEFRDALAGSPFSPDETLYFGESVLDMRYRGLGIGKRFFEEREAHARRLGLPWTCFCAVERADDHPRRPEDYRDLHGFWRGMGYAHHPQIRTEYAWKDLDDHEETPKPMSFWFKRHDLG